MSTQPQGGDSILTIAFWAVEETTKTLGELAGFVVDEVKNLADDFSRAQPDSGATTEELYLSAYFAKSVEDGEKFPPLDAEMKSAVADRQASETIARNLREAAGRPVDHSPEEAALQREDRMQTHLDHQKHYWRSW
jgi:hypothetical protein